VVIILSIRKSKQNESIVMMIELALLTAAVLILQLTGAAIKITPGTSINLVLLPIALGAMLIGPLAGAWLGFVCGVVVYVTCGVMAMVPFTATLFQANPVITALICILKTTVAGFLAGLAYRVLRGKNALVAGFVAAAVTPVVNTGLFILGCVAMMGTISEIAAASGASFVYFVFIICAGFNFLLELAINMLLAPALCRVVEIVSKKR
jgi:uncharacterized membrane protein